MQPALPASRRFRSHSPCAALSLVLSTGLLFAPTLPAHALSAGQTDAVPAPAPVVRPRPRPQTSVPATAPPDAAPLVNRAPRPRPVNPRDLSGVTAASGQSAASPTHPRPAQPSASGATGQVSIPRANRASATSAAAGTTATGTTATVTKAAGTILPKATASNTPAKPAFSTTGLNRTVVVLDPSHGGTDSGSRIGDNILEKNVTLALAFRLRSLLTARGFTVILTRDSDAALTSTAVATPLTLDDRAGIANHARAAACLLLHATGRGNGLHLYTSDLQRAPGEAALLPWLTAQAAWIPASEQLERSVSSALGRSHIALVSSTASIRPVDSLTCPALVVELAPQSNDVQTVNDAAYQERVAAAVAGALVFWQNGVQAPPKLTSAPSAIHSPHHHAPRPVSPPSAEPQP